jgi:hypothetical protein
MTLQEILTMIEDAYPNAATNTVKIRHINTALSYLSARRFGPLVEDITTLTVVDQESYTFPTGLEDVEDIDYLAVSSTSAPANRYEYAEYKRGYSDDNPNSGMCYFQTVTSAGLKKLALYPIPTEANLKIMIRYNKKMTVQLSTALTFVPEFDSRFHELLAYYAIHMIAAAGPSADYGPSNFYLAKYNESIYELTRLQMKREQNAGSDRKDNDHWGRRKA